MLMRISSVIAILVGVCLHINPAFADGQNIDEKAADLKKRLIVERFLKKRVEAAGNISESELKEYYESNKDKFASGEQIRASHILVKSAKEANDILTKIKRGGDFAELAKKYSLDSAAKKGGDLGWFGEGTMVPAFEEAAMALEEGQISDVVKSEFGYHIIKLTGRRTDKFRPFSEVKEQIIAAIMPTKQQEVFQRIKEELKTTHKIKINDTLIDELIDANRTNLIDLAIIDDTFKITSKDFFWEIENLPPYLKDMAGTPQGKREMLDTMVIRELILIEDAKENLLAANPTASVSPPVITIITPQLKRGITLTAKSSSILIKGNAKSARGIALVTVNGVPAELDEAGNFSGEALMKVGKNTITVAATDTQRSVSSENFTVERETGQVQAVQKEPAQKQLETKGTYYALIIGINDYRNLEQLKTAVNDAREIEKVLSLNYNFKTRLLTNATRSEIFKEFNELRKYVKENDNVLIYYAGHGEFDRSSDKSFWLPVDAQPDNDTDWIISDNITAAIKRLPSKHVLIVSDSCYSGTLTRSSQTHLTAGDREQYLKKMIDRPSRTLMASGGNEPVSDGGGNGHSIFADSFIKALLEITSNKFSADEIYYQYIKSRVAGRSDQVPLYNSIKNSGDEGGDFVFIKN